MDSTHHDHFLELTHQVTGKPVYIRPDTVTQICPDTETGCWIANNRASAHVAEESDVVHARVVKALEEESLRRMNRG